jgi:hypothetical protein
MLGRKGHGNATAHGMPDQVHARPVHPVHDAGQVGDECRGRILRIRRPVTGAVAALVRSQHVITVDERRYHLIEPVGVGRTAVQEQQWRLSRPAPLEGAQGQWADRERAPAGAVAGQ